MPTVSYLFSSAILRALVGALLIMSTNLAHAKQKIPLVEETIVVNGGAVVIWTSQQKASRYLWQQTSGLIVSIDNPKNRQLTFTAPEVTKLNSLVFELKTTEAGAWKLPHVTTILTVEVNP